MPRAGSLKPYRLTLLAGVAASTILVTLAVVILAQLLIFRQYQSNEITSILSDDRIIKTVLFTLYQASLSTVLSVLLGAVLAWSLANQRQFPLRNALITLISSALVLPSLVVVLGIVSVYGRSGWLAAINTSLFDQPLGFSIYGLAGILIAHVFFNASFAARILLHRFEAIPDEKQKLCLGLGLSLPQRFRFVEYPAISGALPGLSVTIFLLCFTSFAIVLTLGGSPAYNTLEVSIYEAIKFDFDLPRAFQLAIMQIAICIILVLMVSARTQNIGRLSKVPSVQKYSHLTPSAERNFQYSTIILFSLFFIAPLMAVVVDGAGPQLFKIFTDGVFLTAFYTSLIIASVATIITLGFSFVIASAIVTLTSPERLVHSKLLHSNLLRVIVRRFLTPLLSISAMLYLVFPALVMGLGFFLLFQQWGGNATAWAAMVLIIANATIAIPFCVAGLRPAISSAAKKHDRLAASLGLGGWLRWRYIDWPMLKYDIKYVAALAFCFSLGDMGVIALFGSDNFRTLPWLLYQKFGAYRTHEASAIALVLLLLVITVFWLAQSGQAHSARKKESSG